MHPNPARPGMDLAALCASLDQAEKTLTMIEGDLDRQQADELRGRIARARANLDLLVHWRLPSVAEANGPFWRILLDAAKGDDTASGATN